MTLPNIISLFRLLLVPVVIWAMVDEKYGYAFLIFVIAGVSDLLDGFLARVMKCQTDLGRYLDPLADKILLVAVFIALGFQNILPSWLVILVVFRDFLILLGALLIKLFSLSIQIKPLFISKLNTVMQLLMSALILLQLALGKLYPTINYFLVILTAITTFSSGACYVQKWIKEANQEPKTGSKQKS